MATILRSTGPRNKLLHRFYEPLMVLHALSKNQGDHISRPSFERKPLNDVSKDELRRLYFEAISYACDHERGGDTCTAIYATSNPLTYHIACNKPPKEVVITFLQDILDRLATLYDMDDTEKQSQEKDIFRTCVRFSQCRLLYYRWKMEISLERCMKESMNDMLSEKIIQIQNAVNQFKKDVSGLCALCIFCEKLMKPHARDLIKERIRTNEVHGDLRCNFSDIQHYIGRLAYHVRMIRILVTASLRLPHLFEQPDINPVPVEPIVLMGGRRPKAGLNEIIARMINAGNGIDVADLQRRLADLDQNFEIDRIIQEEYDKKSFKPRIHAELRLLEYLYSHRNDLDPVDGEWYIGCSKPACYCCWLYIRNHPGTFVQPATHQNLYPNWLPPTNVPEVLIPNSTLARHETNMINRMNVELRARTIERIMSCTGRRKTPFDSVTGDTHTDLIISSDDFEPVMNGAGLERIDSGSEETLSNEPVDDLADELNIGLNVSEVGDPEEDDDSDTEGGVSLR